MMEGPLTELRNQRLPRRKMAQTYGKKKTVGGGTAHRDLFGTDKRTDEGTVEDQLAGLSLESPRTPVPQIRRSVPLKSAPISRKDEITTKTSVPPKQSLVSEDDFITIDPLLKFAECDIDLFSTFSSKLTKSFKVVKIGEGSFAEVFKLTPKISCSSASQTFAPSIPTGGAIIKVIPLNTPSSDPNTIDRLSSVGSVAREIEVLRALDSIHGFTRFRGIRIVTGLWPRAFLDAFNAFRRAHRKRAINAAPDDDFDEKQIYALVEMDDAGSEISLIKRPSVFQVYDIFWMTAILLANAEEQIELEHRDLHLSNICVRPRVTPAEEDDSGDSGSGEGTSTPTMLQLDIDHSQLANMTDDDVPTNKLGLSNLKITIIDYTVTRCLLNTKPATANTEQSPTSSRPDIAYDPMHFLSGSDLTTTDPDPESVIQYATYRKTKAAVLYAHAQSRQARPPSQPPSQPQTTTNTDTDADTDADTNTEPNPWSLSVPRTNVIWLSYLLRVLSRRAKGRCKKYHVLKGSSRPARRLQEDMWDSLAAVEEVVAGIDPDANDDDEDDDKEEEEEEEFGKAELERTPASARELLARAVEGGWLGREEIEAFKLLLESEV